MKDEQAAFAEVQRRTVARACAAVCAWCEDGEKAVIVKGFHVHRYRGRSYPCKAAPIRREFERESETK